jgi:protein-disulfide isomerase
MKNLVAVSVVAAFAVSSSGCQQDTKNIERKLDQIITMLNNNKGGGGGDRGAVGAAGAAQAPGGKGARGNRPEHDPTKTYAVPVDGDPFDGPADALVTVVKAYDYACPYCEKVRPTMQQLHEKYGNDVRVVYKQLVVHPRNAMAGALAFCAAGKQGKHKEMDAAIWDKGFKVRQMDLSDVPPAEGGGGDKPVKCWDTAEGCKNVVGYATELGLNVDQFKTDMKGACMQQVQTDMQQLRALQVGATPSFFINGRFIAGAASAEAYGAIIDDELKKAKERVQQGTARADYYKTWVVEKGSKTL